MATSSSLSLFKSPLAERIVFQPFGMNPSIFFAFSGKFSPKEKIEKINDMLIEAASNGKREIFIYEKELWNDEILSELSQNGFTITKEKQGFIEDPCLHISW